MLPVTASLYGFNPPYFAQERQRSNAIRAIANGRKPQSDLRLKDISQLINNIDARVAHAEKPNNNGQRGNLPKIAKLNALKAKLEAMLAN